MHLVGSDNSTILLSVILPSYKDGERLRRHVPVLIDFLEQRHERYEIIVVDDGSQDNGLTCSVAAELGCRYLLNPANQGKGAAVRLGMRTAHGRFRLFTDADVPYNLDAIDRFVWYLDFKEFHMVVGDRTLAESSYFTQIPALRRFGSHVFSNLVGHFVAGGWYDTQCGLKGFRGEVADDLFSVARINRFAFDVELFYIALKRNYDIKRLPVRLRCQEGSSVRIVRDGLTMLRDLAVVWWHQAAGHYVPKVPVHRLIESHPVEELTSLVETPDR